MLIFSAIMIGLGVGLNLLAAACLAERSRSCQQCKFWLEPGDNHTCEEWS